jgi:hypothetical protein
MTVTGILILAQMAKDDSCIMISSRTYNGVTTLAWRGGSASDSDVLNFALKL